MPRARFTKGLAVNAPSLTQSEPRGGRARASARARRPRLERWLVASMNPCRFGPRCARPSRLWQAFGKVAEPGSGPLPAFVGRGLPAWVSPSVSCTRSICRCHSPCLPRSAKYAKASPGLRSISMLSTIVAVYFPSGALRRLHSRPPSGCGGAAEAARCVSGGGPAAAIQRARILRPSHRVPVRQPGTRRVIFRQRLGSFQGRLRQVGFTEANERHLRYRRPCAASSRPGAAHLEPAAGSATRRPRRPCLLCRRREHYDDDDNAANERRGAGCRPVVGVGVGHGAGFQ